MFISVFGLLLGGLGGFADASSHRAHTGASDATNYATDAALDAAVNRVAHTPTMGLDPALFADGHVQPGERRRRCSRSRLG